VFSNIATGFNSLFRSSLALDVLVLSIVLAISSLFIWKFYKTTSKRNLIKLDLQKYNYTMHPFGNKVVAMILYLLEYVVIMPLLMALWFAGLAVILLLIAGTETQTGDLLLITAIVIGAVRILAYFKGEISKDLAKLFPFIALSTFILAVGSDPGQITAGLWGRASEIPQFLTNGVLFSYLFVVFVIEIVLRIFYTVYEFWVSEGGRDEAIAANQKRREEEDDEDDD